jgi:hypothetical protein
VTSEGIMSVANNIFESMPESRGKMGWLKMRRLEYVMNNEEE